MRGSMTRRRLLRAGGGAMLGTAGVVALAACGETQVVTKEIPIETTVIKEVPVDRIVTDSKISPKVRRSLEKAGPELVVVDV